MIMKQAFKIDDKQTSQFRYEKKILKIWNMDVKHEFCYSMKEND